MLEQVEARQLVQNLKMDVLQAIHYIIQAWNEITVKIIKNYQGHTKILYDNDNEDLKETDDLLVEEFSNALETLNFPIQCNQKNF